MIHTQIESVTLALLAPSSNELSWPQRSLAAPSNKHFADTAQHQALTSTRAGDGSALELVFWGRGCRNRRALAKPWVMLSVNSTYSPFPLPPSLLSPRNHLSLHLPLQRPMHRPSSYSKAEQMIHQSQETLVYLSSCSNNVRNIGTSLSHSPSVSCKVATCTFGFQRLTRTYCSELGTYSAC